MKRKRAQVNEKKVLIKTEVPTKVLGQRFL